MYTLCIQIPRLQANGYHTYTQLQPQSKYKSTVKATKFLFSQQSNGNPQFKSAQKLLLSLNSQVDHNTCYFCPQATRLVRQNQLSTISFKYYQLQKFCYKLLVVSYSHVPALYQHNCSHSRATVTRSSTHILTVG